MTNEREQALPTFDIPIKSMTLDDLGAFIAQWGRKCFDAGVAGENVVCDSYAAENQQLHDRADAAEKWLQEQALQILTLDGQAQEALDRLATATALLRRWMHDRGLLCGEVEGLTKDFLSEGKNG